MGEVLSVYLTGICLFFKDQVDGNKHTVQVTCPLSVGNSYDLQIAIGDETSVAFAGALSFSYSN